MATEPETPAGLEDAAKRYMQEVKDCEEGVQEAARQTIARLEEVKWVHTPESEVSYDFDPDNRHPYMELVVNHSFEAAHRLPKHTGKCARLHGHSYRIRVVLKGEILESGMVIDFQEVKDAIDQLDHQYLNDFMENPTAENTAQWVLERIPGAVTVRLWEGLGGCSVVARV